VGNKLKNRCDDPLIMGWMFFFFFFLPQAPCGLFSHASGQAVDPWVPCFPVDQAGPCPLGPLSFPVLLGVLVRTDGYSDKESNVK